MNQRSSAQFHPAPGPLSRVLLAAAVACAFLAGFSAEAAEAQPKLIYRKVFKSSSPEYVEITVTQSGAATSDIRQLDDEPEPEAFAVSQALAAEMFAMAAELNNFNGADLDVKRRLAHLGDKTLRYENGSEAYEARFNYTTHPVATRLAQIFEGLGRLQGHKQTLEFRLRFDRLGVNDALIQLEKDLSRGMIPEPVHLLSALDAVANDSRVIEMARSRARALAERIRNAR
jgi:hypothetical protein